MAADTIRFIVTVAIVVYKGLIPVVGRMLTIISYIVTIMQKRVKKKGGAVLSCMVK